MCVLTGTLLIRALRRTDEDVQLMLAQLERWMQADATYTVRYAVIELMVDFLDARFDAEHLRLVGDIHSSEYYVNMARAVFRYRPCKAVGKHLSDAAGVHSGPLDAQQDHPEGLRIVPGDPGAQGAAALVACVMAEKG